MIKRWLNRVFVVILMALPVTVLADDTDSATTQPDAKVSPPASNASSIQLETTAVTGSRELPKVLVIVPWKTSEAIGPGGRPLASLVEEALSPLDPDVFRRELRYYTDLRTADAKRAAQAKTRKNTDTE